MFDLEAIKQIPITSIIDVSGGKRVRDGWLIKSPLRQERTASFHISTAKNRWFDFGGGGINGKPHGNVIDLYMALNNCSFVEACKQLGGESVPTVPATRRAATISLSTPKKSAEIELCPLNEAALRYAKSRGIEAEIMRSEGVKVATVWGLEWLAWRGDKGGYDLRSWLHIDNPKRNIGGKSISIRRVLKSAAVVIVEGFFDYLSWRQIEADSGKDGINAIVLNSVALWAQAAEAVKEKGWCRVYLCLDNDKAGDEATAKLLAAIPAAKDIRETALNGHKDLNERLQAEAAERAEIAAASSGSNYANEWAGGVEAGTGFFFFAHLFGGSHISGYRRGSLNHYEVWDAQNQRWGTADIEAATPPEVVAAAAEAEIKKAAAGLQPLAERHHDGIIY